VTWKQRVAVVRCLLVVMGEGQQRGLAEQTAHENQAEWCAAGMGAGRHRHTGQAGDVDFADCRLGDLLVRPANCKSAC